MKESAAAMNTVGIMAGNARANKGGTAVAMGMAGTAITTCTRGGTSRGVVDAEDTGTMARTADGAKVVASVDVTAITEAWDSTGALFPAKR